MALDAAGLAELKAAKTRKPALTREVFQKHIAEFHDRCDSDMRKIVENAETAGFIIRHYKHEDHKELTLGEAMQQLLALNETPTSRSLVVTKMSDDSDGPALPAPKLIAHVEEMRAVLQERDAEIVRKLRDNPENVELSRECAELREVFSSVDSVLNSWKQGKYLENLEHKNAVRFGVDTRRVNVAPRSTAVAAIE